MKRIFLLLFALFLLFSACAPQNFPSGGEKEETQDTSFLNEKIPLSWDEGEEYFLDSVLVTLKASASHHLTRPTAEDFPGVSITDIEYLLLGGFDSRQEYDWNYYFGGANRWRKEFRWRLRLALDCKTKDELHRACRALEELDTVALVEPQAVRFADADTKTSFEMPDSLHSPNTVFVLLRHSYSDPNVEPAVQDFEELNYVIGATYRIFLPENYPDLSGKDSSLNPDVCSARREDGAFVWGISFTLDRFIYPAKAMEDLCQRLSERPDVLKVWPAENNIHIA